MKWIVVDEWFTLAEGPFDSKQAARDRVAEWDRASGPANFSRRLRIVACIDPWWSEAKNKAETTTE